MACTGSALPSESHPTRTTHYAVEICGWAEDQTSVSCFKAAQSGGLGAEIFRYGTIEGNTIFAIARLSPDGEIVLYSDHSDGSYSGPDPFMSQTCAAHDFTILNCEIHWESYGEEAPGW